MNKPLLGKFGLIFVVVAAAVFFVYPPEEKIALGLDLQGGSHIIMLADTDSALKYETDQAINRIGQVLKNEFLDYDSIVGIGPTELEVRGTDPNARAQVRDIIETQADSWQITEPKAGNWRASMTPQLKQFYETQAIDTSIDIIRKRIDAFGVKEPTVQKQGLSGDRILIQLPGVQDPQRAKDLISKPARLEWKAVTYPPGVTNFGRWSPPASRDAALAMFGGALPEDTALFEESGRTQGADGESITFWWPLKRVSVVAGTDLRGATRSSDDLGRAQVNFELTQEAGKRFHVATQENLGKQMAIVLDGKVLSAPVIEGVIRDQGVIRGAYTVEQAEDFARQLRSGAITTDLRIIEERTVGPSLGRDSIRAGLIAALGSFAGVLLFMVIYYRLSGINAVIALALNILLVMGVMGYFGATLTLPGIAGLILTVGMAVDSNVLIFERIREELKIGKTVRSAVDQGFSRALKTILDCNVTTLIAAFFLFSYGTGPVQGFAVTLITGLTASMFTAVFVSRQIFELVLGQGRRVESLSI